MTLVRCFILHNEQKEEYETKDFLNLDKNNDNSTDKKKDGQDNQQDTIKTYPTARTCIGTASNSGDLL